MAASGAEIVVVPFTGPLAGVGNAHCGELVGSAWGCMAAVGAGLVPFVRPLASVADAHCGELGVEAWDCMAAASAELVLVPSTGPLAGQADS